MDFIRATLYKLKRLHGYPVTVYVRLSETVDYALGQVSEVKARYLVRRAIALPGELVQKFSYDIAYLAANKPFTYGALYDTEATTFIVEARDLPIEPTIGMHFVMDSKSYEVTKVTVYHHGYAYIVDTKQLRDGINYALVHDLTEEMTIGEYIVATVIRSADIESGGLGILGV